MSRRAPAWLARIALSIGALTLLAAVAGADEPSPLPDDGFLEPPPAKSPWLLDWGLNASAAGLYDLGSDATALAGAGGVAWARLSLPSLWQFHARFRDNAIYTLDSPDASSVGLANDWGLEAAYLQLADPGAGLNLSLGRKAYSIGTGLILSGPGDGLEFQLSTKYFSAKVLGFYTGLLTQAFHDYDLRTWDDDNGARRYVGAYQLGVGVAGQELSLVGMYQGDFGAETAEAYTSWYTGLHAAGLVWGGEYSVEAYLEDGYAPKGSSVGSIQAFAAQAGYRKVFGLPTSPAVWVRYALASGDPDRTQAEGSVGNVSGVDGGFQAFGRLSLGMALRPYFSNLHAVGAGIALRPLEALRGPIRRSSLELKYFYYAKYAASGVIDGGEADQASADVGHGIDLTARLTPWTDLEAFAGGGVFIPGAAFPDGEPLRFTVSGGLSLSL